MTAGRVLELWRYPVKSMRGEAVTGAALHGRGVAGDRANAVYTRRDGELRRLTARQAPGLLAWRAAYPFARGAVDPGAPPAAQVTGPDGRVWQWNDPRLRHALQQELGVAVELRHDAAGIYDVPATVLITVEATRAALEADLGRPLDLQRFRPNLHLEIDSAPWSEPAWAGRALRFENGLAVGLLKPCTRCVIPTHDPRTLEPWPELLEHLNRHHEGRFGIYGRVMAPGRLGVGERVELVPMSALLA